MSTHTQEELENMLEDVVNELELSDGMMEKFGQHGTPPAEMVRVILEEKDRKIQLLNMGFISPANTNDPHPSPTMKPTRGGKREVRK